MRVRVTHARRIYELRGNAESASLRSSRVSYRTITMDARQKAAREPEGSKTVTWQS
jgi:hypothetical protein